MRKTLLVLTILVASFGLFAADKYDLGVGISASGNQNSSSKAELNIIYMPWDFNVANPFVRIESGLEIDKDYNFSSSDLKLTVGLEVLRVDNNLFPFAQVNKGKYSPAMSCGLSLKKNSLMWYSELSLIRILDKDYIYEWLPISLYLNRNLGMTTWQVTLFRFTALY